MPSSFSDVAGYLSIASWLGAQFPQVVENIRNQSVEGLALPFLLNWLLGILLRFPSSAFTPQTTPGDLTNLIGCILTNQLPFQKWLATYFCFVDFSLLAQYLYYRNRSPDPVSLPRSRSHPRSYPGASRTSLDRTPTHYRALSSAAANVAAAAALAAQHEEFQSAPPYQSPWSRHSIEGLPETRTFSPSDSRPEDEDEVDDEALNALTESFHSDSGRHGRRKRVSWSKERYSPALASAAGRPISSPVPPSLQITSQSEPLDPLARGRSLQRNDLDDEQVDEERWQHGEESQRRRSSRASKRGAGMVFMGAWALFGVGTLVRNRRGVVPESGLQIGRVLSNVELPVASDIVATSLHSPPLQSPEVFVTFDRSLSDDIHAHDDPPPDEGASAERVIGRIFAWACTTLYLTSRLPQIWKNFARKSVEGLSVYLFIFAFFGNFFYVLSILTAPKMSLPPPEASAYLAESLPYLLGSGGTFMFDVTIVAQTFIYRARPRGRGRRGPARASTLAEEEEGLISAEGVDVDGGDAPNTPHRRRLNPDADGAAS
ncbi:PQ loop repeat-domain-containing protein [Amylostereum chailletii]|nr:PQ loop repeat-domain-containing protein [Amylostereum chailletii]